MGCFSGCLMTSAGIQKLFCEIYSAFECSFDEFVGEKVVSPSYSSTIFHFFLLIWFFSLFLLMSLAKDFLILFIFSKNQLLFLLIFHFSSVQSLSRVRLFATPWIAARQASLSITNSRSSLRLTSIESAMPSSHLILCHPLFLLPPSPPSIRVFSNESTLRMRWPKYWSFSFSIIPSKEIPGLISFRMD